VLSPKDSPLGRQLSQYICVRITRMDHVDIGLFDRDWNNAVYFFALNADEKVYFRYGGRDSASPDTYLDLNSLELALKQGLALHRQYLGGELKLPERPQPAFPREIPLLVERTNARGQCVECHLIGDFRNIERERDGTLDKLTHLYRSPDVKTLGIELDVPRGLAVKQASGAAEAAGMRAGDRIAAWNGKRLATLSPEQHRWMQGDIEHEDQGLDGSLGRRLRDGRPDRRR